MKDSELYIDLGKYLKKIKQDKFRILIIAVTFACIAALWSLWVTPKWESKIVILPQKSSTPISEIVLLAGMANTRTNNEEFYQEIIRSNDFLDSLTARQWLVSSGDSISLFDLFDISKEGTVSHVSGEYEARVNIRTKLRKIIEYSAEGPMIVKVMSPDPILSSEMASAIISILESHNKKVNRTKAGQERQFVEERYEEFAEQLVETEAKIISFNEQNKFLSSPELRMQSQRLIRELEIKNLLVMEFRKKLEMAKVEEIKQMDVLNVLQTPEISIYRSFPKRKIVVLMALIMGFFIGIGITVTSVWLNERNYLGLNNQ